MCIWPWHGLRSCNAESMVCIAYKVVHMARQEVGVINHLPPQHLQAVKLPVRSILAHADDARLGSETACHAAGPLNRCLCQLSSGMLEAANGDLAQTNAGCVSRAAQGFQRWKKSCCLNMPQLPDVHWYPTEVYSDIASCLISKPTWSHV